MRGFPTFQAAMIPCGATLWENTAKNGKLFFYGPLGGKFRPNGAAAGFARLLALALTRRRRTSGWSRPADGSQAASGWRLIRRPVGHSFPYPEANLCNGGFVVSNQRIYGKMYLQ